ncbi:VasL domain-containing protein [Lonsdalea quercina]|uniref:VasL domain-containing protein n=1 Tax=Lonsdalea quercina TaxID=71657 RepID=UPI003976CD4C
MQDAQQALTIGRDPRMLPEYETLRIEINKLSHASRPEVDWSLIHKMAGIIFEKHGVDLQTAVYFVLARSRLQGLNGFTEGCEFLANLIVTQWDNFWPPVHQDRARIEMIDWFIARVSEVIRGYAISQEDRRLIYRCERSLQLISEKLHNVGLSRVPRIENLVHFIEGYTHLFDETEIVIVSDDQEIRKQDMQIPPMVYFKSDGDASTSAGDQPALPTGSILVGREKGEVKPTVLKIEARRKHKPAWFWFACGLLTCALPVAAVFGWQMMQARENAAVELLMQPAQALPDMLDYNDIRQVRISLGEQTLQGMEGRVIARYQAQLDQVKHASPLAVYQYGENLKNSLQMLYPDSLAVKEMGRQWQESLTLRQDVPTSSPAYLEAQARVDGMLKQLQELEQQRKTVSISYLKSQFYEIQKSLLSGTPFTQRLKQLETQKAERGSVNPGELERMENELDALSIRLFKLKQKTTGN